MNDQSLIYNTVTDLIDLDRYPIQELGSEAAQALIADCQAELAQTGACVLPGFVKPEVAGVMVAEVQSLLPQAFENTQKHNVYFKEDDPALPEGHPARRKVRTSQKSIAYDLIPQDAGIRQIYNWAPVREFLAAVLDKEQLYLHGDPLAALNIMVMDEGGELGWHYDRADFVTTILLQKPEAGGVFEFVPNLRTPDDENYSGLAQLLDGTHPDVVSRGVDAGTLRLFAGHNSIHHVSPVRGKTQRMIAVLSYKNQPNIVFSQAARTRFYGRAG
ncbi:MAG: HalD/BesD family halogenase [Ardenticatenaceae bacterium]